MSTTTPKSNLRIKTNPINIVRAALFMANQDIRYCLNGLQFEPASAGGIYIVGTNGHAMTVIHDSQGVYVGDQPGTILRVSKQLIAACRTANRHSNLQQHFLVDGRRISIAPDFDQEHYSDLELFVQPGNPVIEGKFPDWRAVLPDFQNLKRGAFGGPFGVSPFYLARFKDLAIKNNGLTFWQEAEGRPAVVQMSAIPEMLSIIMPMSGDSEEKARKHFQSFPQKAKPAVKEQTEEAVPA